MTSRFSSRRRGKKNLKRQVKSIVNSLAETKQYAEDDFYPNTTLLEDQHKLTTFKPVGIGASKYDAFLVGHRQLLQNIVKGTGQSNRIGNKISLKGIHFNVVFDNTNILAEIPLYITFMVVQYPAGVDVKNIWVKPSHGTELNTELRADIPLNASKLDIHTNPVNPKIRVLHRYHIRLSCASQPDLAGPRYDQRTFYVPMNKTVTYTSEPESSTSLANTSPNFSYLYFVNNPTQLTQSEKTTSSTPPVDITPYFETKIRMRMYYKDS